MKANQIKIVLDNINVLPYKKILINGDWGIGKTKYINDFMAVNNNVYYISLFGKKSIDVLLQELYYEIVSKDETGVVKQRTNNLLRKLKKLDQLELSFYGLNITAPFISDILSRIEKKIGKKDSTIIIIDDFERKHQDLDIKEILGVIDAFSRLSNLKIIVVSALKGLDDDNQKDFDNYKEKAIDKIYTITDFADEAPQNIIGIEVWSSIKNIYMNSPLKNLRTLEKFKYFLEEVLHKIQDEKFTDRFNKEDLYKMCFAVVVFVVEHKEKLILLPPKEKDSFNYTHSIYGEDKSLYINQYILKNSLTNFLNKNVLSLILDWFITGECSQIELDNHIDEINSYKSSSNPFFGSAENLKESLEIHYDYLENLDGSESLISIIRPIDEIFFLAEKINLPLKYNANEIVQMMIENIISSVDINNQDNNYFYFESLRKESNIIKEMVKQISIEREKIFHNLMLNNMENKIHHKVFNDTSILEIRNFSDYVMSLSNPKHQDLVISLIKSLKTNGFYLPLPEGEINENHWRYCHLVFSILKKIRDYLNQDKIFEDAKQYFDEVINDKQDKMLELRIKVLFESKEAQR
ncbi:hypothetical protein ACQQ6W_11015 [Lysinibacillus fusiformis]